jgi:hypothetical protein
MTIRDTAREEAGTMARALPLLLAALAGCAAARVPLDRPEGDAGAARASARELALAGLRAYVVRNDAATAVRRLEEATRRDGRDPWARYGAALLARRRLDDAAEVSQWTALVDRAPAHPLALVAARRLMDLAERAPPLAQAVEAGLAPAQERLRGLAAIRVRSVRTAAAAALGDRQRAAGLRAENGVVTAWTLAGPFGALHALQIDERFAPEEGVLPGNTPAPAGLPAVPVRAVACSDGVLALEGEPPGGDIFYLATDVTLARGGDYYLTVTGTTTLRAFVDGAPVVERRAYAGFPPLTQVVPVELGAGRHRLLVKIGRGGALAHLRVALSRAGGAPSDATFAPALPGNRGPAVHEGGLPPVVYRLRDLAELFEREVDPEVALLAAARDALEVDRETSKALLDEALARAPRSAALLVARAEARLDDATLSERVARARSEADLEKALAADPGHAAARLARAELARAADRRDEAAALLDGLAEADAARPRALMARAQLARARDLAERAERLAEEARRTGGDCAALDLLLDLALKRDALARQDELVGALGRCPGGRERLVEHRRRRGDLAGALAVASEVAASAPARVGARLARASLLAASGDPRAAAEDLADLARTWPRDPRIEKGRAEYLDAAGDATGARTARERALLLDGGDLALRRALSMEGGKEPLDDLSEDGARSIAAYRAAMPGYVTSSVTVLDLGAVEAHPGGAYTERIHTVVEARDQRAVDHVGEVSVPEGADLLLARTVKRDGRVLEPEDALGEKRTLSLPGLEPGDFAEWEWLRSVPARGPAVPGFTADPFFFRGDTPLWRSTYTATASPGLDLEVDAHHMPPPLIRIEGGRAVVRVLREGVPPLLAEPNAPMDSEHMPFVQVGAAAGRDALAQALADSMLEGFRPSHEVRVLAAEIARGASLTAPSAAPGEEEEGARRPGGPAGAAEAFARAAYRRVNEIVLGQGGAFTEPAGAILSRGRGNRTILLKSLLDALGVKARVALVRDFTRDPSPYRFPRADLYGYAVLRVEAGGRVFWLDPTTRGTPFGTLPGSVRAVDALVLPGPGEVLEGARTPAGQDDERHVTRLQVALGEDGGAMVEGTDEYRGFEAAALRASIEALDVQARRQAVERALSRSFRGPALVDFRIDGEGDMDGPLLLRWSARVEHWARFEEGRAVVDAPLFPARLASRFLQRATRETPLLVPSDERSALELTVTLPAGWAPVPAAAADVRSSFGRYRRVERGEPGRFVREDGFDLLRARVAPADYASFAGFASTVDAAQETPMVFHSSTQGKKTPAGPDA